MPILDSDVAIIATKLGEDVAVIQKFLAGEETAPEVVALIGKVKASTFMAETDFTTRIENERKIAAADATKLTQGNTYGAIDKRIKEKLGIDKLNAEEKTDAYLERAIALKLKESGGEPTAEITRLKADLAAKEAKISEQDGELTKLKNDHQTEKQNNTINSRLDSAINALNIDVPAHLKDKAQIDAYIDGQREFLKFRLGQKFDVALVDGKEQFTDKLTGKVVRDAKLADVMNAKAFIESFAPSVVSLKQEPSGKRGTGFKDAELDLANLDSAQFAQYATVKELREHLTASGVELTSQAAMQKLNEYVDWKGKQK